MAFSQEFKNKYINQSTGTSESQLLLDKLKAGVVTDKQQEQPVVEKKGFLSKAGGFAKEVGRDIATPFAKLGTNAYNMIQAGEKLVEAGTAKIMGYDEKAAQLFSQAGEEAEKSRNVPLLGEIKPITTVKDVVGTGADLASNIVGFGVASGAVKTGIKAGLKIGAKSAIKTGAKTTVKGLLKSATPIAIEGATSGFLHGTGKGLQEDKTVGQSLASGLTEGAIGAVAAPVLTGGLYAVGKGARKTASLFDDTANIIEKNIAKTKNYVSKISGKAKTADDVFEKVAQVYDNPNSPASILAKSEKASTGLTFREKLANVDEAVKNRVAGKPEQLQEHFDVTHAANKFDTNPTVYEYGGKQVEEVRNQVVDILNDTGSEIGKFREKISTIKAPQGAIDGVVSNFGNEIGKLNLVIRSGKIIQQKGTVSLTTKNEIKLLQELYAKNLMILKQSPTAANIIDSRISFDGKINFAKEAREASNILDPISRKMRGQLAEINRNIIGNEQSSLLADYSNLREGIHDLNFYVDGRSGGEYLLRLVLSGRGRKSSELIATIAKYTGIDLMDNAVMAKLATELIGNERQMNLFRQEITKAGLDAYKILKGDVGGAIGVVFKYGKKKLANPEDVYMQAARNNPKTQFLKSK